MEIHDYKIKFLLSLIVSAALVGFSIAGFIFSVAAIKDRQQSFLQIRRDIALLDEERSQVSSLEHLLADIQSERKELESAFIASDEVVEFIEYIEGIARNYGVALRIQSFEVGNDKSLRPHFVFDAAGSLNAVLAFLEQVEYAPYQIEVVSLFVTPEFRDARGLAVAGVVGFNITATVHNFIQ